MQKIMVILGSTRPERKGVKIYGWIKQLSEQYKDVGWDFVDLAEVNLPLLDEPKPASSGEYAHDHTKAWSGRVAAADGFIIVTPEYNHGYPAVLKNALDFLYHEWAKKPVGFVSYGSQMGVRSVEQLRQVAGHLQMVPIREQVSLLLPAKFDKTGQFTADEQDNAKVEGLIGSIIWWAKLLAEARAKA